MTADAPVSTQFLTFRLGGEFFAVPILRVREIVELQATTRIPTTPPSIRGVTNLRGQVLPVIDLAYKLTLEIAPASRRTCIVVIETEWSGAPVALGVVVEEVCDVIDLAPTDIDPPPPFGAPIPLPFLAGIGRAAAGLVLVIDLDRVLSPQELMAAIDAASLPPAAIEPREGATAAPAELSE